MRRCLALGVVGVTVFAPGQRSPGSLAFNVGGLALAWLAGRALAVFEQRTAEARRRAVEAEVAAATTGHGGGPRRAHPDRPRAARHRGARGEPDRRAGRGRRARGRGRPGVRRQALRAIRTTGTGALAEMRRMVTMLREADEPGPLAPQPGIDGLPDLVAATRDGRPRRRPSTVDGTAGPLPAGLDLAAYRIVQEALSNVRRHAAASGARVRPRLRRRTRSGLEVARRRRRQPAPRRARRARPDRHAGAGRAVRRRARAPAAAGGGFTRARRAAAGARRDAAWCFADDQELVRVGLPVILERAGLDRGRRGGRRRRGGRARRATAARRRPDGRADAAAWTGSRRPGGCWRRRPADAGARADHLRPRRVRLRRRPGRRQRLPAQGRVARRPGARGRRRSPRGDAMLAPAPTRRLLDRFAAAPAPGAVDPAARRAHRARAQVLALVARGQSNRRSARALFLSEATVKTYVSRLLDQARRCATGSSSRCSPTSAGWCAPGDHRR